MSWRRVAAVVCVGSALPGCALTSSAEIIRSEEACKPVRFQSPAVAEQFAWVVKLDRMESIGGTTYGLPFLALYAHDKYLSPNAKFNDAVVRCDADQDGVITEREVEAFRKADGVK